jgi:hypothetical protein
MMQLKRDAERIASLEAHCDWLSGRVTQLQELVDAMQVTLVFRTDVYGCEWQLYCVGGCIYG